MKERIEDLVGPVARTMWISTFHCMCARILRREAQRLGYKCTFTIYDEDDRRRLIKRCLEELDLDPKRFPPEAIARQISDAKNQLLGPAEFREQSGGRFAQAVADVYALYEKRHAEMNAMDFDDLLMKTVELLERFPDRLEHYQHAFRFVLIDEYQDTNHAQYRLANLLAGEHGNLAVVGDDDQCIYSWRGADIRNILEFERDYPDAKVVRLEQNYRSTQTILDAANAVVTNNRKRKGKNLWTPRGEGALVQVVEVNDERAEAQFVASEVQKLLEGEADGAEQGLPAGRDRRALPHQRPVARARGAVRPLRHRLPGDRRPQVLRARRGPGRVAYLTVVVNPDDEQRLLRIVNMPKRGIGATSLQRLQAHAASVGESLWGVLRDAGEVPGLSAGATNGLLAFVRCIEDLQAAHRRPPGGRDRARVLDESGYEAALEAQNTLEAEGRLENLEEFVGVAAEYDQRADEPSLDGFLQEISLYADIDALADTSVADHADDPAQRQGPRVPGGVHRRHGGGRLPPPALARRAEHRGGAPPGLRGITRAMDRLYLVHARARNLWGGRSTACRRASWPRSRRTLEEQQRRRSLRELAAGGRRRRLGRRLWRAAAQAGAAAAAAGAGDDADGDATAPGAAAASPASRRSGLDEEVVEQFFAPGDRVLHATLGEGTVLAMEHGGIVLVRFENDGSERRLMASVAPLKLRG